VPHTISFSQFFKYDSRKAGITIDVELRHGDLRLNCAAKVDTGSEVCLFERQIGETLEFEIERGVPKKLGTLTGSLWGYGHEITLIALGLELQTFVYFAESYEVKRNILGRQGWLQLIKLGLIEHDCELYLGLFDE
jgi:hypothetical protein